MSLFRKIYRSSKAANASPNDGDFEAAIQAIDMNNVSHTFNVIETLRHLKQTRQTATHKSFKLDFKSA